MAPIAIKDRFDKPNTTPTTMPTKEEIRLKVRAILAEEANIEVSAVIDTAKLSDLPLSLDKSDLLPVTLQLRRYVKSFKEDQTVLVKETRSSGLTVNGLIDLIDAKLK